MRITLLIFIASLSFTCEPNGDKEQIERQIKGFLAWYSGNWDNLRSLIDAMIDNSMIDTPDSTKVYKVDFQKAEIYLSRFKQSGFISETYLNNYRDYFKASELNFERIKQYMGPPIGFDYDFVFRGNMFEEELKNPDKAQLTDVVIEKEKAKVTITFDFHGYYIYKLTKVKNVWL